MKFGGTLLLIATFLAVGTAAHARILGGGIPKKPDCYVTLEGIDATGSKANLVECTDGDPTCDKDLIDGQCTFTFTACAFQTDAGVVGCAPGEITKINARHLTLPPVPITAPTCAASESSVVIKLNRRNKSSNKQTLNIAAFATGKPRKDQDHVTLKCKKRPASPSGAFVME